MRSKAGRLRSILPPGLVQLHLPAICQLIGNLPKFCWYTFSIYRYLGGERHFNSHVFVSSVSCPITHHSDPSLSPALNKEFNELPIRPRAMSAGCNLAKNLKDKLLLEKKNIELLTIPTQYMKLPALNHLINGKSHKRKLNIV